MTMVWPVIDLPASEARNTCELGDIGGVDEALQRLDGHGLVSHLSDRPAGGLGPALEHVVDSITFDGPRGRWR